MALNGGGNRVTSFVDLPYLLVNSNKGTYQTVSQNFVFFLIPIDRASSIYSCKFSAFLAPDMKLKSYGASKFAKNGSG